MNKTKLLLASRYKSLLLWLPILFIIAIFSFSIDDKEAINLYLNKLQEFSDHKISKDQKLWIQNFYLNNPNKDPLQAERHKTRDDFNKQRKHLIQQWETYYKIKWPQIKTTKKTKTTNIPDISASVATINYQAHHAIPINAGGVNIFWNITPINSKNHKLLHDSFEEKACFSHDFFHQKFMRFILKIQEIFLEYFGSYINKKGTNYAH